MQLLVNLRQCRPRLASLALIGSWLLTSCGGATISTRRWNRGQESLPTSAQARRAARRRVCTDDELDVFLFQKTYGPIEGFGPPPSAPNCVPRRRPEDVGLANAQLSASPKPPLRLRRSGASGGQVPSSLGEGVILKEKKRTQPYFVQLHTVKVEAEWCAPPCEEITWEKAAAKPAAGNADYQLLELCIWSAERRLALYEFDETWYHAASNSFHDLCGGIGWACPQVVTHRENARLWQAEWPEGLDDAALSQWVGAKLADVFGIMYERGAEHYGFAYSGHGSRADGALFEGVLHTGDSQAALKTATEAHQVFSLFNFGGNCVEGKWNMLAAMQPFTNYIIASDLPVNGVQPKEKSKFQEYMKLHKEYDPLSRMKALLKERPAPLQLGKDLLAGKRKIWEFCEGSVKEAKLKQSVALFDMQQFLGFQQGLKRDWAAATEDKRASSIKAADKTMCDIRAFGKELGGTALDTEFLALRVDYVSTADMFNWAKDTEGLGFNFLGWKAPPCDIAPALGGASGTKVCKDLAAAFDAGFGGCETYAQGGANHDNCAVHWMNNDKATDCCAECGACVPAGDLAKAEAALISTGLRGIKKRRSA